MSDRKLPTRAEALDFLEKAGCSQGVIEHSKTVSRFAVKIAKVFLRKKFEVDVRLVEVSGLLHDIGRSKTHTVDHGVVGSDIAHSFNLPGSVVRIIECHVGGGVPKEEAKQLGWPVKDYLPRTLEEKIVCYADKRIEGLHTVSIKQAVLKYSARLGKSHPAIDRIRKLNEEIVAAAGDLE